jgi:hypothetical protein
MAPTSFLVGATETCTRSTTASAVTGLVILAAIVGGFIALGIANGRARARLAAANSELDYLRPENARLQQWVAHLTGTAAPATAATVYGHAAYTAGDPVGGASTTGNPVGGAPAAYPTTMLLPPQWYADPSTRHQLRYWDGGAWTAHVSDDGATSLDPPEP